MLWMVGAMMACLPSHARAGERLRFSATAVNAETGATISEFRIVRGWIRDDLGDDAVMWEPHIKSDGLPDDPPVIDEEDLFGRKVRFVAAAQGFSPAVSPWYLGTGDKEYQFRLSPGSPKFSGQILTPEGRPADGVTVAIRQYGDLLLSGGEIHFSGNATDSITRTRDGGRFSLPRLVPDLRLIAAHPDWGYAEFNVGSDATNATIRLEPWAAIEGTFNPPPGSTAPFRIMVDLPLGENPRYLLIPIQKEFEVPIGSDGKFAFHRVPPRAMDLMLIRPTLAERHTVVSMTRVELVAGQTARPVVPNNTTRPNATPPGPRADSPSQRPAPSLP
ncbi:MAG: hypothetical protein IT581_03870 [Verrucomicrobiales bacterium]|nr:hypothetical protein [Verrucomicrobiales bacterium]